MNRTSDALMAAAQPPEWLLTTPHIIEYDPSNELMYFVRLLGAGRTEFDKREHSNREDPTRDAVGFGKTLIEAAENARRAQLAQEEEQH